MNKIWISLFFVLAFTGSVLAQGPQCRTSPVGASTANCASEAFVTESIGAIPSSGVTSIDSQTGAFTTGNGVDSSGKTIELTAARRTLPTTQSLTSGTGATYTTPSNALWLEVFMVGGGGGGGGAPSGSAVTVAGSDGTASSFNSVVANPGKGAKASPTALAQSAGGAGGTGGTGTATRRSPGSPGTGAYNSSSQQPAGSIGGSSYFGGGAVAPTMSANVAPGVAGGTNTGGGGSGAQNFAVTNNNSAAGGGGGEFVYLLITSPAASYTYTVGSGGAGGSSTTNGGAGGSGFIFVVEHYGS